MMLVVYNAVINGVGWEGTNKMSVMIISGERKDDVGNRI
jgi:hypothetical protein